MFCSFAFSTTSDPPGSRNPVTWQPTQLRSNCLLAVTSVAYAPACRVFAHSSDSSAVARLALLAADVARLPFAGGGALHPREAASGSGVATQSS
jgi:hypothetical protein